MPSGTSIEQIWRRVLEGDRRAWPDLVLRLAPLVYTTAIRCGLTELDADDCAQRAWINLYRHRESIRDPLKLPGWLARTTRRLAVRMLTRGRRRVEIHQQSTLHQSPVLPDEELLVLERQAVFELLVERLDPRCRKLIRVLFLSDSPLSYKELAEELNLSINSLGPLRSRCLDRFKRLLEESGYDLD
jgi:RNA polymerase sigma factor (sigma-70 family)